MKILTDQEIRDENERHRMKYDVSKVLAHSGRSVPAKLREKEDFMFWAQSKVWIKPKGGGRSVRFRLNRPQWLLISQLEVMRKAGRPIRLILLKARQWGGSTAIIAYIAWLQLVHKKGLNSLILAHQLSAAYEIKDMFDRLIISYGMKDGCDPDLHKSGFTMSGVGKSGGLFRIVERDCKMRLGSAERPDAVRGGDYNLVHLSEVGLWKSTLSRKPEDIVRAATSGVLLKPYTLIVMESTANGTGTFFHKEYMAAKEGKSQFKALFIPWYEIEDYQLPVDNIIEFYRRLEANRDDTTSTDRSVSGKYLWNLWEGGATLEAINWYVEERKKYSDHAGMASEYPSFETEAFAHSGERVFAPEAVERLRMGVTQPAFIGEIDASGRFVEDSCGLLKVWRLPNAGEDPLVKWDHRYIVVVDVGGRSDSSDWSVIAVFDRIGGENDLPEVVAQWRGHSDHDLLAKNAARIAGWYGNALLVIESNTLEAADKDRDVDGNQAPYLLTQLEKTYRNLYKRQQGNGRKAPGFHTNRKTKPAVIGRLVEVVRDGLYIERDANAIDELAQYERRPNGSFGATSGCHDDILMTRAIGLYIDEYEAPPPRKTVRNLPRIPATRKHRGYSFGF